MNLIQSVADTEELPVLVHRERSYRNSDRRVAHGEERSFRDTKKTFVAAPRVPFVRSRTYQRNDIGEFDDDDRLHLSRAHVELADGIPALDGSYRSFQSQAIGFISISARIEAESSHVTDGISSAAQHPDSADFRLGRIYFEKAAPLRSVERSGARVSDE